jgi:hypothetical protein
MMKPDSGNPELDKLHEAALDVVQKVEDQSGMKVMNDGPARALHFEEAYRAITQDDNDLDPTETQPLDVRVKPTTGLSRDDVSIIEITSHWGQGVLETSENIQRTLQDVVQIAHNVIAQYM